MGLPHACPTLLHYYFVYCLIVVFVVDSDGDYLFALAAINLQVIVFFRRIRELGDWVDQQPLAAVYGVLGFIDVAASILRLPANFDFVAGNRRG